MLFFIQNSDICSLFTNAPCWKFVKKKQNKICHFLVTQMTSFTFSPTIECVAMERSIVVKLRECPTLEMLAIISASTS